MQKNERKYYESEAKRKWQKENTVMVNVKLQKSTDKDILEYLGELEAQGISRAGTFKKALRIYMQNESGE